MPSRAVKLRKIPQKMRKEVENGDNRNMKTVLRLLARPMLASVFVLDGFDALQHPDDHVERFRKLEPTLEKIGVPPVLTSDAKALSRVAGAATVVAGLGLATGKYPRICALLLAVINFPITVVNNPIWAAKGSIQRKTYTRGFVLGASLAGGLGMAMLDAYGQPSLKVRREIVRKTKEQMAN